MLKKLFFTCFLISCCISAFSLGDHQVISSLTLGDDKNSPSVGDDSQSYTFRHENTKGYNILTFYKDVNNVMWLGTTSGLISYPQLMSHNPNAYDRGFAELNSSIQQISGDNKGRLWMKTINRDVLMYDPKHNKFEFDTPMMFQKMGIPVYKEYDVWMEQNGDGWVWKGDNLFLFDNNKDQKMALETNCEGEQIMGLASSGQTVVLLTRKAIYYISKQESKIIRRVEHHLDGAQWTVLFVLPNLNVWLRTSNLLDIYDYTNAEWHPTITMPSEISGLEMDGEQHLWVCTTNDGIFLYDCEGQLESHLYHNVWDVNSLQSNKICSVYYDKDNDNMWIAYIKGGLSVCNNKNQSRMKMIGEMMPEHFTTDVLTFSKSDEHHRIYAGLQDQGLFVAESAKEWKNIIPDASITALHYGSDGNLWVGLYGRGLLQKSVSGEERLFFENDSPYDIEECWRNGEQYIYTALLGEGVWKLNVKTGAMSDTKIADKFVLDIGIYNSIIYAATTGGFYMMEDGAAWRKLYDGMYRSFCIDQSNNKWILGNDGYEGLTVLDKDNHPVQVPDELAHAPLKSIISDLENRVWVTSGKELIMLQLEGSPKKRIVQHVFNVNSSGNHIYYNYHAIQIDKDNHLWLGTSCGYQCFKIDDLIIQMHKESTPNALQVACITINDKVRSPGQGQNDRLLLDKDVIFCDKLDLNYDENNIVIECCQTDNKDFASYTYYYQLQGRDSDWHLLKDNAVVLSNLSPGKYNLMVKTQASQAQQLMSIHIAPPFWLSGWAYLFYALMAAGALYGGIHYYNSRRAYQFKLRELELQQEQQTHINEMKLRFFTNISHDLRTPLTLIIGPANDLLRQATDPQQVKVLSMIHRNAEHLLSLVNQILDFRRLEYGREKLLLSYGDIVSFMNDICASFRLKSEKESITLSFQPSVERVETLFDRDKTTKVMMNLLSNAFKFSDPGDSIVVRLEVSDGNIIISVIDTGKGVPDEEKNLIFNRFYQSKENDHTAIGSGIGLHIVREYVQLQGGEITVSDNPEGHGTVFRFTVPLKKQASGHEGLKKEDSVEDEGMQNDMVEENEQHSTTILLVDDNSDLLAYMQQTLTASYRVLTASNGKEALAKLKTEDVDIVVSDVMMPEMDGLEFCKTLKSSIETSHIPVVLLTAKAMNSDELLGLEAGADDYITKPFSMEILRQRIHNLLERNLHHHHRFATEMDIEPSEITVTSLDEQFIARAISIVEENIADPDFNVEQLSMELGVHRSQLYKKLQHLTGKTPVLFIRLLRLKRGKQLLEQSGMYISEVAYKVGFNSPRIFSKYFKEEFGMTPKEYSK